MLKDKSPSELAAVSELMELGHTIDVARVRKDTNWSEFVRFPHEVLYDALAYHRTLCDAQFAERLRETEDAEEQERNHCGGSQG